MTAPSARLTTPEVCSLARYGRATLWRRIDAEEMPKPIDRGGAGFLFDKTAVLIALGMYDHEVETEQKSWDFDPVALRESLARKVRRPKAPRRQNVPRLLPSPGAAPALRLVGGDSASAFWS